MGLVSLSNHFSIMPLYTWLSSFESAQHSIQGRPNYNNINIYRHKRSIYLYDLRLWAVLQNHLYVSR